MHSILLVDDDMNLLRGLRRALRDQPYDLFVAHSAEDAKQMFRRRTFSLAVVDQQLGGAPGSEFIAWISEFHPATVRMMLTGHPNVNVAQDAINRGGVFRFLTKPIRDVELALAIREGLATIPIDGEVSLDTCHQS